jgi:hypothetical protein
MDVKTFSEIVPEKKSFNVDAKVSFAELVDKDFVVADYEVFPSKFEGCDEFAVILVKSDGQELITTTSSRVIMGQLEKMKDELPVKVRLEKRKKYFTFC